MTIYDQVGGTAAVRTAVTVFYNRVLEDDSLVKWFENVDLSRLKAHQRAFLGAVLGGPHAFTGRELTEAHAGREITDAAFDAIAHHLTTALADLDVDIATVDIVAMRIEEYRAQIVSA